MLVYTLEGEKPWLQWKAVAPSRVYTSIIWGNFEISRFFWKSWRSCKIMLVYTLEGVTAFHFSHGFSPSRVYTSIILQDFLKNLEISKFPQIMLVNTLEGATVFHLSHGFSPSRVYTSIILQDFRKTIKLHHVPTRGFSFVRDCRKTANLSEYLLALSEKI